MFNAEGIAKTLGLFLHLPFGLPQPRVDHAPAIVYIALGLIIAVIVVVLRLTMSIGEGASSDTVLLYPPRRWPRRWLYQVGSSGAVGSFAGFGPFGGFTHF